MNQAIDIIIPCMIGMDGSEHEGEKIIDLSGYGSKTRPLYLIKRKEDMASIRKVLTMKKRVLLRAFNSYAYYSCDIAEMQQKVHEHMASTGAYSLLVELDNTNRHCIDMCLNKMDERVRCTLNTLLYDQSITFSQWRMMRVDRLESRLDSLYFLPNTRRENVPWQPMLNCRRGLTHEISHFLRRLLQPIYDRWTLSATFKTGIDVIDALEDWSKKGLLQSNTLFVTLHIHDLCTIIPHESTMAAVQRFLEECVIDGRVQGITIPNIIALVRLYLENQFLLYENKLYRQIRGSGVNSPLTMLLANIYLYYWQQDLVAIVDEQHGVFGRCLDELFFTWNESKETLQDRLNTIHDQDPHIQMIITIDETINYLDVNIGHLDGDLKIQVAHDLGVEPYALPFVFGHPRHQYSSLPRAALMRAVRCCVDVSRFANELEDLRLSFEYNGFGEDFFTDKLQLFLEEFDAVELGALHGGETNYDQSLYDRLREHVFNDHQQQKKATLKRLRRQTMSYRWQQTSNGQKKLISC